MASLDANSDGSIDIEEWCNNLPRAMYLKIQAALTDDGRLSTFLTLESFIWYQLKPNLSGFSMFLPRTYA